MKLKKAFCLLAVTGLIWSVLVVPVLAQETPTDDSAGVNLKDTVKSRLDRLQTQRQEIEDKVKERRAAKPAAGDRVEKVRGEAQKRLESKRADRVRSSVRKMIVRFEAATNRLDNLAGRVSARLDKLAQGGKNVSASQTALEAAKTKIEGAKTKLAETKTALEMVADSENPKEDFASAKAKLNEVKTAVKEAQAALVDVINSIKGASKK